MGNHEFNGALLLGGCHMLDVRDKDEYLGMGWDST